MNEKKRMIYALYFPGFVILLLTGIKIWEIAGGRPLSGGGIVPRDLKGLTGILTAPLVHADFSHLWNNAVPLFFVLWLLIYFYRQLAYKVFFLVWLITGLWVWAGARDACHIGASGVVYGLISFIFFSGLFRRIPELMTLSLLMVFLYGSMIWGIFPFVPDISWESHLSGGMAGLLLSLVFLREGPQRKIYEWETEEEEEEGNEGKQGMFPGQDTEEKEHQEN